MRSTLAVCTLKLTVNRFAFVEYDTPEQAAAATRLLHGTALDKKHTIAVNKLTDIDRYGREGRIDESRRRQRDRPQDELVHDHPPVTFR